MAPGQGGLELVPGPAGQAWAAREHAVGSDGWPRGQQLSHLSPSSLISTENHTPNPRNSLGLPERKRLVMSPHLLRTLPPRLPAETLEGQAPAWRRAGWGTAEASLSLPSEHQRPGTPRRPDTSSLIPSHPSRFTSCARAFVFSSKQWE